MTSAPAAKPRPPLSRYRVHAGTVYVSGQVPVKDGAIVKDSFAAQVVQTLGNLRAAVEEAGSSLDGILKCGCFLRRESDLQEFNRLYAEFFAGHTLPARTTLIADPPNPEVLVEIEAIAAVGA